MRSQGRCLLVAALVPSIRFVLGYAFIPVEENRYVYIWFSSNLGAFTVY